MDISAFVMMRHGDLPAWLVSESLPSIIPLSQAIATQRTFDDYLVLQELSTLRRRGHGFGQRVFIIFWELNQLGQKAARKRDDLVW